MLFSNRSVVVTAPGRLALTLIDLSENSLRVNGGAGIAISNPSFVCRISGSTRTTIEGLDLEYVKEAMEYLQRLGFGHVRVEVLQTIPAHNGFGSKTATLLAIGRGVATLFDKEVSTATLAKIARRARTSGIGVNTFDRGGFLIDGGHPASDGEAGEKFVPTRYSTRTHIPQPILSHPFNWPLLIILPAGETIEGEAELRNFRSFSPFPRPAVHEIAYITTFLMATAIVEEDYLLFCSCVNQLQKAYLKARELDFQTDQVRYVVKNAPSHGIDAIGLSSNGPALYALSRNPNVVEMWINELIKDEIVKAYWWTSSPSTGAKVAILS